jgi:hypothetical protein
MSKALSTTKSHVVIPNYNNADRRRNKERFATVVGLFVRLGENVIDSLREHLTELLKVFSVGQLGKNMGKGNKGNLAGTQVPRKRRMPSMKA